MPYVYLAIATFAEVLGTSFLKAADGFTRPWPSLVVIVAYGVCFYTLSLALRGIPIAIAYTIWCGGGIALIAAIGTFIFHQKLDLAAVIGLSLISAGVLIASLFSKSIAR